MLLSHVHVGISDFDRAYAFYSGVMRELGFVLKFHRPEKQWAGWMEDGVDRPLLLVGRPFDGNDPSPGNGQMVALLARDRSSVDRTYEWALAHGATDDGAPGLRPHYHPDYYGAYFHDPDRNKICICCHTKVRHAGS